MSQVIPDNVASKDLDYIKANCNYMVACSTLPAVYADVATYKLGQQAMVTGDFTVQAHVLDGRELVVAAKSTIAVTANGTINYIVLIYSGNSEILLIDTVNAALAVTTSNTFDVATWKFINNGPNLSDWFDQDVKVAASPTHVGITLSGLTASKPVRSNASKALISGTVNYPDVVAAAGKILASDGTDFIASTPTYPNAAAGLGKFIRGDGTNFTQQDATLQNLITNSGFGVWSNSGLAQGTTGRQTDFEVGNTLITNGGFDSATTGWTGMASVTIASVAGGQSGNGCRITGGGTEGWDGIYQAVTCVVGKLYKYSAYVKDGTSASIGCQLGVYDSTNVTRLFFTQITTGAAYTQYSVIFEATETTHYLRLYIQTDMAGYIWFDTADCHEVTPGCVAADAKACDGWLRNYNVTPPSIWREQNGTNTKAGSFYALKITANESHVSSGVYVPGARYAEPVNLALMAGRIVTFGCWVKTDTANHARLRIYKGDANVYSSYHTGGNAYEWLEVTTTCAAAPNAFFVQLQAEVNTKTVYASQPMLVFGSSIGAGNYQPIPGEFVDLETQIQYGVSSTAALINAEAASNGKCPKGASGAQIHIYGANPAAGQYLYVSAGSGGIIGFVVRTQVANLNAEGSGFQKFDPNGDFYTNPSDANWGTWYVILTSIKVS